MTGEELKRRRQKLGLTQAQLGIALQRPTNTIARWEQGARAIEWPGGLRFLLECLDEDRAAYGADHAAFVASLPTFLLRDSAEGEA